MKTIFKKICKICLCFVTTALILVSIGCIRTQTIDVNSSTPLPMNLEKEQTIEPTDIFLGSPTFTPTITLPKPTATKTQQENFLIYSTQVSSDTVYIYKDITVTVKLKLSHPSIMDINLDNLEDNKPDDNDIEIFTDYGNQSFYALDPKNNVVFFHSNVKSIDFNYCFSHIRIQ